jgi:high-affinity nickel-transport protein
MSGLLAILGLGFFLGMRHATDPDHVVAITTLVSRHRSTRSAALIGVIWGVGHTLTILAVGSGILLLGWVIPARVGLSLELSVGLMLVLLGIVSVRSAFGPVGDSIVRPEALPAGELHGHPHPDPAGDASLSWLDRQLGWLGAYQLARPLIVGIVHGLAGSAAVALLVLTTIQDPAWSVFYLVVFGFGTIVGMMLITLVVAAPFAYAGQRFTWLGHGLRLASGVISVGFGLFLAWRIGVVQGLFSGSPHWTPQ